MLPDGVDGLLGFMRENKSPSALILESIICEKLELKFGASAN